MRCQRKNIWVELNLPTQKNEEDIYDTFDVKQIYIKLLVLESRLTEKIIEQYYQYMKFKRVVNLVKVSKQKKLSNRPNV